MTDLFGDRPADIEEQIREIKRELQMRERVYPQMIKAGRLTVKKAMQQNRAMEAVLKTLQERQASEAAAP